MATVQALAEEPKRYNMKLEMLKRAVGLLEKTSFNDPQLARQLDQDVKKTTAELGIYNEAMRPTKSGAQDKQKLIVQCDAPEYFLDIAQKHDYGPSFPNHLATHTHIDLGLPGLRLKPEKHRTIS